MHATTGGVQDHPIILALPNGGFLVAWEDNSQNFPDTSQGTVRAQTFDAIGETCYRSWTMTAREAREKSAVPVGLLEGGKVSGVGKRD